MHEKTPSASDNADYGPALRMHIIDSHLHVIASDTSTYPKAPIGGHQSEWSQQRPVDARGVIEALDDAGVARAWWCRW